MRRSLLALTLILVSACAATRQGSSGQRQDDASLEALKREVMRDPFADTDQFSVNFALYSPRDWHYPFAGAHVISPFGGSRHHAGTDIKTVSGSRDTLRAAFAGVVTLSESRSGYGNVVILRHANGLETYYAHNRKNLVTPGQWLNAGDPLAIVGRTGRASTEHLHFEVRVNGQAFDSSKLFDHAHNRLLPVKLTFTKKKNGTVKIK
ncbi:MAG: M23 family metallopeptidase [Prevotellaceae bacterium]|nr:M23 family metallopeptidase [Prevotellaceae bacterium]